MPELNVHALLRRFVRGTLTAPEEAELERHAAEDPALAEALAALRQHPEEDHADRTHRMIGGVRSRQRRGRRWLPYAAAASLLLVAGFAALLLPGALEQEHSTVAMAESEPTVRVPDSAPAPQDEAFEPAATPQVAPPTARPERERTAPAATAVPAGQPRIAPPPAAPEQLAEEVARPAAPANRTDDGAGAVTGTAATTDADAPATTSPAPASAPPSPPPPAEVADDVAAAPTTAFRARRRLTPAAAVETVEDSEREAQRFLSGRITDAAGRPLTGALVRRPGQPLGERTDSSGAFRLPADVTLNQLIVTHPDFEAETIDLENAAERLQISLQAREEAAAYDWLAATSHAKVSLDPGEKAGYAAPLIGYTELREAIENNRPAELPRGRIRVSFLVAADGTLSDFRFRGRPDPATMDYVGTALVETSAWNVVQGQGPVRVHFKLRFD